MRGILRIGGSRVTEVPIPNRSRTRSGEVHQAVLADGSGRHDVRHRRQAQQIHREHHRVGIAPLDFQLHEDRSVRCVDPSDRDLVRPVRRQDIPGSRGNHGPGIRTVADQGGRYRINDRALHTGDRYTRCDGRQTEGRPDINAERGRCRTGTSRRIGQRLRYVYTTASRVPLDHHAVSVRGADDRSVRHSPVVRDTVHVRNGIVQIRDTRTNGIRPADRSRCDHVEYGHGLEGGVVTVDSRRRIGRHVVRAGAGIPGVCIEGRRGSEVENRRYRRLYLPTRGRLDGVGREVHAVEGRTRHVRANRSRTRYPEDGLHMNGDGSSTAAVVIVATVARQITTRSGEDVLVVQGQGHCSGKSRRPLDRQATGPLPADGPGVCRHQFPVVNITRDAFDTIRRGGTGTDDRITRDWQCRGNDADGFDRRVRAVERRRTTVHAERDRTRRTTAPDHRTGIRCGRRWCQEGAARHRPGIIGTHRAGVIGNRVARTLYRNAGDIRTRSRIHHHHEGRIVR